MNKEDLKEKIKSQIRTLRSEFCTLSNKHPNDQVNTFKLKYVNDTLTECNKLLGEKKPYKDFETFDLDELPTNSDVLLMLSLYSDILFHESLW